MRLSGITASPLLGNLFIETDNPRSKGSRGWFSFCQADLLAYGDAVNSIFYFIRIENLRNYIELHKEELEQRTTSDGSRGFIIPLFHMKHLIECAVDLKEGE